MGKYPVDAVEMLAKIALSTEAQRPMTAVKEMFKGIDLRSKIRLEHLIAVGVEACFEYVTPAAVFVPTRSGATARSMSRFRFPVWTVAVSSEESTCRRLLFSSGVYPVHESPMPENWNAYIKKQVADLGFEGKIAILTRGPSREHFETNHGVEILDLTL
jgi:pyruvate kinase